MRYVADFMVKDTQTAEFNRFVALTAQLAQVPRSSDLAISTTMTYPCACMCGNTFKHLIGQVESKLHTQAVGGGGGMWPVYL